MSASEWYLRHTQVECLESILRAQQMASRMQYWLHGRERLDWTVTDAVTGRVVQLRWESMEAMVRKGVLQQAAKSLDGTRAFFMLTELGKRVAWQYGLLNAIPLDIGAV